MKISDEAKSGNDILQNNNSVAIRLFSKKGFEIYFPKLGILSQTAEARLKKINATVGCAVLDDGTPMRLNCIADKININPKDAFFYAPSYGVKEIREEWGFQILEKNPSIRNSECVISLPVCTGALTHGLSIAGYLFVNEGDVVLVPDLHWENYELVFGVTFGARIESYNLFKDNAKIIKEENKKNKNISENKIEESIDIESFRKSVNNIKSKKKIVLLNFPNNPSGYSLSLKEYDDIISVLKEDADTNNSDILVICDDAYFGLFYEDNTAKESLFSKLCSAHENILCIKIDGPTKEDYVWGFRVGFITYGHKGITKEVCSSLEDKTAGAVRATISSASSLSQNLLLSGYSSIDYDEEKKKMFDILKGRYLEVKTILSESKFKTFFSALPFNSGYFMCIRLVGIDAFSLRKLLLDKYDIGVIAFDSSTIRIAFSSVKKENIRNLFESIYDACLALTDINNHNNTHNNK